jgi:hypothetical protein
MAGRGGRRAQAPMARAVGERRRQVDALPAKLRLPMLLGRTYGLLVRQPVITLLRKLRRLIAKSWILSRCYYPLRGARLLGRPNDEIWYFAYGANMHDSAFRVRRGIQLIECRSGRIKLGCPGQVTRELPDQLRAEPLSDAEQSVARGGAVNGHVAGRADAWPIVAIKGPAQTDNELEISKF